MELLSSNVKVRVIKAIDVNGNDVTKHFSKCRLEICAVNYDNDYVYIDTDGRSEDLEQLCISKSKFVIELSEDEKLIKKLFESNEKDKQKLIFTWIKSDVITLKQFKMLLNEI